MLVLSMSTLYPMDCPSTTSSIHLQVGRDTSTTHSKGGVRMYYDDSRTLGAMLGTMVVGKWYVVDYKTSRIIKAGPFDTSSEAAKAEFTELINDLDTLVMQCKK